MTAGTTSATHGLLKRQGQHRGGHQHLVARECRRTCPPRAENEDEHREQEQRRHAGDEPPGHVTRGIAALLGRKQYAFYCEKEPDRERKRRPDAHYPERQERTCPGSVRRVYVKQIGRVELRDHPDDECRKRHDGDGRYGEHQPEGLADAVEVDADKDQVAQEVDNPPADPGEGLYVTPYERGDRRRGQSVLD